MSGFTRYRDRGQPRRTATATVARGRPGRHRRGHRVAHRARPAAPRHQAPVATDAHVMVARGRSDGRTVMIVPESQGQPDDGSHAAARAFHDGCRSPTARAVLHGYRNRYEALRTRSPRPSPRSDDDLLGDAFRWSTCSPSPATTWPTTGDRGPRRDRRRHRHRPVDRRPVPAGAGAHARRRATGCSPRPSGLRRSASATRPSGWRRGSRPRRR